MKKFIDELINRLEEYQDKYALIKSSDDYALGAFNTCEDIIDTVSELEKEYIDTLNNWVSVSERLPKDNGAYIAQSINGSIRILGFTRDAYKLDKYDFEEYKGKKKSLFYEYDSEYGHYEIKCVAWQPLPALFVKRGDISE